MGDAWSSWGSTGSTSSWGGGSGGFAAYKNPGGGGGGGASNSPLFPDFLGGVVSPIGSVLRPVAGGAAHFATGVAQGLFYMARANLEDLKNHPLAGFGGIFGPLGVSATASLISHAEGGHGGAFENQVLKPAAAMYKAKYLPIIEHPLTGSSYHNALADPVGTIFDVLTLVSLPFTGGGSAALRGVGLTRFAEAGAAMRAGRTLTALDEAGLPVSTTDAAVGLDRGLEAARVGKTTSPVRYAGGKLYDWGSARLPTTVAGRRVPVSTLGRIDRHAERLLRQETLHYRAQVGPFQRTLGSLTEAEAAALPMIAHGVNRLEGAQMIERFWAPLIERGVHPPTHTQRWVEYLRDNGDAIDAVLANPEAHPQLVKAADQARNIAELQGKIYTAAQRLDPATLTERVLNPARYTAGLKYDPEALKEFWDARQTLYKTMKDPNADAADVQAAQDAYDAAATTMDQLTPRVSQGIDPAYGDKFYVPHTGPPGQEELSSNVLTRVRDTRALHKSEYTRYVMGDMIHDPSVLSHSYLQAVNWRSLSLLRKWAMARSQPLDESFTRGQMPGVRKGWVLMKGDTSGPIPRMTREADVMNQAIDKAVTDTMAHKTEIQAGIDEMFPTSAEGRGVAQLMQDGYRQVPEALARQIKGEMRQSTGLLVRIYDRYLDVWRALVLKYRPAWLVNNIVGNHLIYVLQHAGRGGLRAYLRSLELERGPRVITKLGKSLDLPQRKLLNTVANEIPGGGSAFLESGVTKSFGIGDPAAEAFRGEPGKFLGNRVVRAAGAASHATIGQIGQATTWANLHIADDLPRLSTFIAQISTDPELRQAYKLAQGWEGFMGNMKMFLHDHSIIPVGRLGEQTSVEDFLKSLPESKIRQMTEEVDRLAGNFRDMSPFERNVVKRIIPFYGWFKVIGLISLRLGLESPARLSFLHTVNEIAQQDPSVVPNFAVPSYLTGAVATGPESGGQQQFISTTGLNPFQTITQLGTAGTSLGGPPTFGSEGPLSVLTPAAALVLQTYGVDPFYGGTYTGSGASSAPTRFLAGLYSSLPQYRLAQQTGLTNKAGIDQYQSTLYANSWQDYLANYLGVPIKNVRKNEAISRAKAGQ